MKTGDSRSIRKNILKVENIFHPCLRLFYARATPL